MLKQARQIGRPIEWIMLEHGRGRPILDCTGRKRHHRTRRRNRRVGIAVVRNCLATIARRNPLGHDVAEHCGCGDTCAEGPSDNGTILLGIIARAAAGFFLAGYFVLGAAAIAGIAIGCGLGWSARGMAR